ncbi:uncharacterized protein LOC119832278 [Zerene cesonia]|uniref:uncharacterized protein LOC119832278 n=1 Tax=Zerene cesonia TaxID=33412 RepID=UPI0018E57D10|nr:uncharacterized protein LOC119832278 [Zerene cesonia]
MSVIEDTWDGLINLNDIEYKTHINFEKSLATLTEQVTNILDEYLGKQKPNILENKACSSDEYLQHIVESNTSLKQEIDLKLLDLTQKQSHYKNFKEEQKLLTKEIKETHEAFLMAKKYYKKFLKLYYTIESKDMEKQVIFIQFFTESKKDVENYSIRLLREPKIGKYQLQAMTPKLTLFKDIQLILGEKNDVPGILCCIRDEFKSIRESKKLKRMN